MQLQGKKEEVKKDMDVEEEKKEEVIEEEFPLEISFK